MGFVSWWKRYYSSYIHCEVDDICEEYIEDSGSDYEAYKKEMARKLFPRTGEDKLRKKELFIQATTQKEHEFQKLYMDLGNNRYNRLKSKISRDKEQQSRLQAQMKWRKLLSRQR